MLRRCLDPTGEGLNCRQASRDARARTQGLILNTSLCFLSFFQPVNVIVQSHS